MEVKMPALPKASEKSEASAESPKSSSKNIDVVATAPGFIYQQRKAVGDVFQVSSIDKLGSWMQCLDPAMEKKRLELMEEIKKRNRKVIVDNAGK